MDKNKSLITTADTKNESLRLLDTTMPSTVVQEYTFESGMRSHSNFISDSKTVNDDWKKSYIKVSKRSGFLVTLSIIGCMMGAQTYSLPYATLQTGLWMSIGINLYKCIIGIISCKILIECQLMSKWNLPAKIGYYCFGRSSIFVICSLIGIGGIFQSAAYFKVFSDVFSVLLCKIDNVSHTFWCSKFFGTLILFLILVGITLKKRFSDLKYPSLMHMAGIIFLIIFLTVQLGLGNGKGIPGHHIPTIHWDLGFLTSMPTFLLAYGCQTSFVPSMNTARNRDHGMKIAIGAFSSIFTIYTIIICIVLYLYGEDVKENFLLNIETSSDVFSILILCMFLITSTMHIPFVFFLGKDSTLTIVDELMRRSYSKEQDRRMTIRVLNPTITISPDTHTSTADNYLSMNPVHYYCITILLFVIVALCSLAIRSITFFLSIVGSNASTLVVYLLPPVLYIKCYHISQRKVDFEPNDYQPKSRVFLVVSWIFIVKGLIFLVLLNFVTFYTLL
ncbi:unnamed protein product [Moneuplotes crassus]|uniref:Amino acid transporter transmembrane domain-containing protein n=1 Tax=Euplotes crassus TaxID=5936 RepID=A0AAD1UJI0_EUPCR|nr:unnamed protein product [Moneuplotes crassus]